MTSPAGRRLRRPVPLLRKQLIAVIDDRTTMVCLDAAGRIRDIDDPFETLAGRYLYPPFHIHCRSVATIYLPGVVEGQRGAANTEIRRRPAKEKRKGPGGFQGPVPPPPTVEPPQVSPDLVAAVSRATVPVVRTTGTVAGVRYRDDLLAWRPHLARLNRVNRGPVGTDSVLVEVTRRQGFDALPNVVDEPDVDRAAADPGARVLWRGYHGPDGSQHAEQLRSGPPHAGPGIYAAGVYWAASEGDADRFAGADGVTVRAVLPADARVIAWSDLETLMKETSQSLSDNLRRRFDILLSDPGRFAAAMGFDAIALPNGDTVVLNRSVLVVAR